ncbi:hypothetical protein TNCV_4248941 [Trichonephila clavipes]|nr:hypothetical protein TNCV_4248941 [Trichonephila clavipes]
MDGDHLLQCTGLDEYQTNDIVSRYWETQRQMVKKPSTSDVENEARPPLRSRPWVEFQLTHALRHPCLHDHSPTEKTWSHEVDFFEAREAWKSAQTVRRSLEGHGLLSARRP